MYVPDNADRRLECPPVVEVGGLGQVSTLPVYESEVKRLWKRERRRVFGFAAPKKRGKR